MTTYSNLFTCMRNRNSLEAAYKDKLECAMMYEETSIRERLINKIDDDYEVRSAELDIEEKR